MKYSCPKCNSAMSKGEIAASGGIGVYKKTGWFSAEHSKICCYVCVKCGYMELYAEKPEIFNIDEYK